jgi:hypothetical protein
MLTPSLAAAFLLAMTSMVALAQVPADPGTATATRAGHAIGVGDGSPQSDTAGNIGPAGSAATVAPTLPSPAIGNDAMSRDYLRTARAALVAGRTGEAQQSLEMAETRALDRTVVLGRTNTPSSSVYIARIGDARRALGNGESHYAIVLIDVALLH